jgi:hypothetical protein
MKTNDLSAEFESLQTLAESLMTKLSTGGDDTDMIIKQLDAIHLSIEDLEKKIGHESPTGSSECNYTEIIDTKLKRLLLLLNNFKRNLPRSVDIANVSAVSLISSMEYMIGGFRDQSQTMKLSHLVDCVAVAERPDFSPIQLVRKCNFEADECEEVETSWLTSILKLAHMHSSSESSRAIKLTMKDIAPDSREPMGVGLCLVGLGISNKLEQLFSPTSVISNMAKVCHALSRSLLGDFIVESCLKGNTSWLPLVYPQYSRKLSFTYIVEEARRLWQEDSSESGLGPSLSNLSYIEHTGKNLYVDGRAVLAIFFVLKSLGDKQRVNITVQPDDRIRVSYSGNIGTELYMAAVNSVAKSIERHHDFIILEL